MGRLDIRCDNCGLKDSFRIKNDLCQCCICGNKFKDDDWEYSNLKYIEKEYERVEISADLQQAFKLLNETEKLIIELRFGLSNNKTLTQREIGDLLNVSSFRVSFYERKALRKLRMSNLLK